MKIFIYGICVLVCYLIGTMNPAYLMAKAKGVDIRTKGSKNAGASNALIVLGKLQGGVCAFFDISKAFCAVFFSRLLLPDLPLAFALSAVAVVLGHVFPFYMRFRGGKGLACLTGIVLGYDWRSFIVFFIAEILLALIFNYICVIPLTASVIFNGLYFIRTQDPVGTLVLLIMTLVIWYKHTENLRRITRGEEVHLSYLWNKDQEIKRIKENTGRNEKDYFIEPK